MTSVDKYKRQTVLPEIGLEGQEKLRAAKVLCIGVGGLGCPALQYLTGAGVGTIGIIDHDTVDITNLQRQILFGTQDVGQSKAQTAKTKLEALNPDITICAYNKALSVENALSLFTAYDIIIDGTDNFAAKFLINDAAVKLGKPVVYGALQGFEGQVSVFHAAQGPCYRCLHPHPPKARVQNCAENGVIGAVAGIVGTTQAMETIKFIVGHASFQPLIGKLWLMDGKTMDTRLLTLPKKSNCPVCSCAPEDISLVYIPPVCKTIPEIDSDEIGNNVLFIDVREQNEWDEGFIEGARHMPLSALLDGLQTDLPANKNIIVYCEHGIRSLQAVSIFIERGHTNTCSLRGGYEAWCCQATQRF